MGEDDPAGGRGDANPYEAPEPSIDPRGRAAGGRRRWMLTLFTGFLGASHGMVFGGVLMFACDHYYGGAGDAACSEGWYWWWIGGAAVGGVSAGIWGGMDG